MKPTSLLTLNIFFFSTEKVEGKAFNIDNIEISEPFKINFNKNKVIDDGFEKAFIKLIRLTLNSQDQKKIKDINHKNNLNQKNNIFYKIPKHVVEQNL